MWPPWIKYTAIMVFIVVDGEIQKPARAPMIPNNPFIVIWNVPTEPCKRRFNVQLDLAPYYIVANPNQTLNGPAVTLFYFNRLGFYPHIDRNNISVHGGFPQNQSILLHLAEVKSDIESIIPMKMFNGLGVIDWERWKPLWERNTGNREIYQNLSIARVQQQHPNLGIDETLKAAKEEFETAARDYMNKTLFLVKKMRPYGLWGFYLFPDCYNYYSSTVAGRYRGQCPALEADRNNDLFWLWKQSSAIFPSIYLESALKSSPDAWEFTHHQIEEALRVATYSRDDYDLPVFVYTKPVYINTMDVLTKEDLVHTIGESAALGAAGSIIWGRNDYGRSRDFCLLLRNYVSGPLGHYVINVTLAARLCSQHVCSNHGKCVRRYPNIPDYLHLPSPNFEIQVKVSRFGKRVVVKGHLSPQDIVDWRNKFICQCFQGQTGLFCEMPCSYKARDDWK